MSKQLCPHCGSPYAVPAGMGGKKLLCRHCKGQLVVPEAASPPKVDYEVVEDDVEVIDDAIEVVEDEPEPESRKPLRPLSDSAKRSATDALGSMSRTPKPLPSDPPPMPSSSATPAAKKKKKKKPVERESIVDPGLVKIIGGGVVVLLIFGAVIWLISGLFRSGPDEIPDDQWREIVVENRFKVKLPGPAGKQMQNLPMGIQMQSYSFSPDPESFYAVACTEGKIPAHLLSMTPEANLNDSCDGSFMAMKQLDPDAKELSRTSIQIGEHPGKELVVYVPRGKGRAIMRVYLIHGRRYIVTALGKGLRESHENVQRLFASFVPLAQPEPEPESKKESPPEVVNGRNPRFNPGAIPLPEKKEPPPEPDGPKVDFQIEMPKGLMSGEFTGGSTALGFSPDGKTLVTTTASERVYWIDVEKKSVIETRRIASPAGVNGAAIAPQGDKVAFYKHGGLIYLWQKGERAETVLNTDEGGGITQYKAAISPDGETLCATNGFAFVRVFDLKKNKKVTELKPFGGQVGAVTFSPDGTLLAAADAELSIWNPKTQKKLVTLEPKNQFFMTELEFAPDGKSLIGVSDRTVYRWTLEVDDAREKVTGEMTSIQNIERITNLKHSPDGKYIIGLTDAQRVRVWDAKTLKRQGDLNFSKTGQLSVAAFRPTDSKLALGCGGQILFVDLGEQKWD